MLFVGERRAEHEFNDERPKSPIADLYDDTGKRKDPVILNNGYNPKTDTVRINRIFLTRTATVELLSAVSPSEIWVRLRTHVTKDLKIQEPYGLCKLTNIKKGGYAIAPFEDRVFARCRIVDVGRERNGVVRVFFIDEGVYVWVRRECLAKLEDGLMYHPWQAIKVALCGVAPARDDGDLDGRTPTWNREVCAALRELLAEFRVFRLHVVLSSKVRNDYEDAVVVHMHGRGRRVAVADVDSAAKQESASTDVTDDDNYDADDGTHDASIAAVLRCKAAVKFDGGVVDASRNRVFDHDDDIEDDVVVDQLHRNWPANWKAEHVNAESASVVAKTNKDENGDEKIDIDFEPSICQVPVFSAEHMKSYIDQDEIYMHVEGEYTQNPYEWYARPIHRRRAQDGTLRPETEWLIEANEELKANGDELEFFYADSKNRKMLSNEIIIQQHEKGNRVYAMCAVSEERSAYSGEWQRVEVLCCGDFASVRFLDSGGRDQVVLSSLYMIHRQHCTYPPMCLQLCVRGIRDPSNETWTSSACRYFRTNALLEDTPIKLLGTPRQLVAPAPPLKEFMRPTWNAHHVWFVDDLMVLGHMATLKGSLTEVQRNWAVEDGHSPFPADK